MTNSNHHLGLPTETPLVLLAGGRSSRVGEPKGLVSFEGRTWLENQLEQFGRIGGKRVVIVLGHESASYLEAFPILAEAIELWKYAPSWGFEAATVINRNPEQGQFSSLQAATRWLASFESKEHFRGAYIMPIDVPFPKSDTWAAMIDAWDTYVDAVIPVYRNKGGHPVALSRALIRRLAHVDLADEQNARLDRQIQNLSSEQVRRVEVPDERVCMNLNTPEDFSFFLGLKSLSSFFKR